jgi:hypothetical protein
VSTLRQYLEALGTRLESVAVFADEARQVPIRLGRAAAWPAAVSTVSAPLAPTNADDHSVSLGSCPVQQSYNTTRTNGLPPTHTTGRRTGPESLVQQGKRR